VEVEECKEIQDMEISREFLREEVEVVGKTRYFEKLNELTSGSNIPQTD
jgi:hypothetical protein